MLGELLQALRSDVYACHGGHRNDGKPGGQDDWAEEIMDEAGVDPAISYEDLLLVDPRMHETVRERMAATWVETGACKEQIEITLEYEGEYGEISYPVADGPCVPALGLDMDEDYSSGLWHQFFERRRLRRIYQSPGLPEVV